MFKAHTPLQKAVRFVLSKETLGYKEAGVSLCSEGPTLCTSVMLVELWVLWGRPEVWG